jgi:hypothetical protein
MEMSTEQANSTSAVMEALEALYDAAHTDGADQANCGEHAAQRRASAVNSTLAALFPWARQSVTTETIQTLMRGLIHENRPGGDLWGTSTVGEKAVALKVLRAYVASHPSPGLGVQAGSGETMPLESVAAIQSAVAVLKDVSREIADWEDKALRKHVDHSVLELSAIVEAEEFRASPSTQSIHADDLIRAINTHRAGRPGELDGFLRDMKISGEELTVAYDDFVTMAKLCNAATPLVAEPGRAEGAELDVETAREQAGAWTAVCATLTEVDPGWASGPMNGMDSACDAIRRLASRPSEAAPVAQQQPAGVTGGEVAPVWLNDGDIQAVWSGVSGVIGWPIFQEIARAVESKVLAHAPAACYRTICGTCGGQHDGFCETDGG